MDKFKINTKSNLKDFVEYNKYTIFKKNNGNRLVLGLIIMGFVIGFMGLVFDEIVYVFLFIGVFAVLVGLLFKPLMHRNIKSLYTKNPTVWLDVEITFTEEKLVEVNKISTSEVYWKDVVLSAETDNLILLYISDVQAALIQKELLTDEQVGLIKKWYKKQ